MMAKSTFIDGEGIRKVHPVRQVPRIFEVLAIGLAQVPELRYIKIFPARLSASNVLSEDGKKSPVVHVGAEGIVAVELLIDTTTQVVQFYAITSAVQGGSRLVRASQSRRGRLM